MLVAQKAVDNKIKNVKSTIGNTIDISPAGFTPGSQANNALTTNDLNKVKSLAHVANLTETLTDRLPTTGSDSPMPFGKDASSGSTTSLTSPITLNSDGNGGASGGGDGGPRFFISGGGSLPANFSLPVSFLGTNDAAHINDTAVTIKSGKAIDASKDSNEAMISQAMADKNNLKAGSTFTAYDATLTVAGIFSSSTRSGDDTVVVSLATLQRLSNQSGVVTSAVATVDSVDNLGSVTTTVKNTLGSSSADVTNSQDQVDQEIKPLNNVRTISTFSLIGAVAAGAVIILLTMVMIVRERRKEIGVVKAIGGSNVRIMGEFMVEALTLTIAGAVIGLLLGVIAGQPVTKMLVDNSTSSAASDTPGGKLSQVGGGPVTIGTGPRGGGFSRSFRSNAATRSFSDIKTQVGPGLLLEGFGAAVLIAVLGSALSSGMIAKIRPSEVLRSE